MSPTLVIYLLFPFPAVLLEAIQFHTEKTICVTFTFTTLYKDGMILAEEELGLSSNQTSDIFREDDEGFQNQENLHPHMNCNSDMLEFSLFTCKQEFDDSMMNINSEHWCDMEYIISSYNHMTICVEYISEQKDCYYPNAIVHHFLTNIHAMYFHNCTEVEHFLPDAPHTLVVILTLIPVSLIPVLVLLVVWKSKV